MDRPNPIAVHIGYHKTATSWFQQMAFSNHPQVAPLLGGSEFGVVASDAFVRQMIFARDSDFDATEARALFTQRAATVVSDPRQVVVVSAERFSGHCASGGYDGVRIADRLHATLPEAKVFWVLRHQAEAIRSEYKQIVLAGWPGNIKTTLAPMPRMKTTGVDLAYWEYHRLLSGYARRFGPERIMLIDYGRFTREPAAVLGELARFLDIEPWSLSQAQLQTRINEGESDGETRMRQRLNHITKTELNPYPPVDIPNRVSAMVVKMSGLLPRRKPLFDASFDAWADERFRLSNDLLNDEWGLVLTRSYPLR
ncbi:MAG TPA: sulfotransferase [Acidimicrobiales bacterium]|nr:sulfotransferase [Acidimicrobiales bacterium]